MTIPCTWLYEDLKTFEEINEHYIMQGCEQARRVLRLVVTRGITIRAAKTIVGAAMCGIGCVEGTVREEIEANKNKPQVDGDLGA